MAEPVINQLTPKQLRILTLIRDYQRRHGYSPTMQELADVLGVTKVTVFEHVVGLEKKGLLRRSRHRARSLQITEKASFPDDAKGALPLMGYIAAGAPIEAIENPEVTEPGQVFAQARNAFVLEVRGDSMIDEQIRDGDLVVVERCETAPNGATVVALLEGGEATLKKFYREGKRIRLQPANPAYKPLYPDEVQIQGVVIGVMRTYR